MRPRNMVRHALFAVWPTHQGGTCMTIVVCIAAALVLAGVATFVARGRS